MPVTSALVSALLILSYQTAILSSTNINDKPANDTNPPFYIINLDLPGSERWVSVCSDLKEEITRVYDLFLFSVYSSTYRDEWLALTEYFYEHQLSNELKEEINYMASCTGYSVENVMAANLVYDFTGYCTSIITQDSNNNIYHSRNLDYPLANVLKPSTLNLNFTKNGEYLFNAMTFAGYIGLWTGEKYGVFSISANDRFQGSALDNMENIIKGNAPIGLTIRDQLENGNNFNDIVNVLSTTQFMAPVYFIIAGVDKGEGVIITRNQTDSLYPLWIGDYPNSEWYLIETNHDWWTPTPSTDNRREAAVSYLDAIGQENIDTSNLWDDVMSVYPVLNPGTTFTTMMGANFPQYFKVMERYGELDNTTSDYLKLYN